MALGPVAHAVPLHQIEPTGYICEGGIGGSAAVILDPQANTVSWRVKNHPVHTDHHFTYWVTNAFGHSSGSPPFYVDRAFIGYPPVTGNSIYGVFDLHRRDMNFQITFSAGEMFYGQCIGNYEAAAKLLKE